MALSSSPLQNLSSLISPHGIATATARTPTRRNLAVQAAASSDTTTTTSLKVGSYEQGNLVRPKWTGETPLSRMVRALISFKPLYSILKLGARQVLISTAEKNNIPWREMTKKILESEVYKELDGIQNRSLVYPDSAEAEAATKSMFHECPARAIVNVVREAFRLLRPGGTFAMTDNSELSPVLFTLMKSTEPFLDEYYLTDMDETLKEAGFVNITSILTDPRHVTLTATVPQ
ncbi:hypothetical protein TSUD_93350 [Trifolium subterraneum]|uniref:Methyltransferase type 11 domain-containing protein n=1 Tax=Trifolium subterraneum TaxID=3900 RepID=A0A2Z6N0A1_TRISU|nr:hypothetical protein TSUD_93350 [Trifolium subterraneum]